MALAHRTTISWSDGGNSISGTISTAPTAETVVSETIPASSTDVQINIAIDVSTMTNLIILASGGDMTLEVNSGSSPTKTLALLDGIPFVWNSLGGYLTGANAPFGSTDVTGFFITSVAGGTFRCAVGVDATP